MPITSGKARLELGKGNGLVQFQQQPLAFALGRPAGALVGVNGMGRIIAPLRAGGTDLGHFHSPKSEGKNRCEKDDEKTKWFHFLGIGLGGLGMGALVSLSH